jgi:hypothetical protein
MRFTFSDRFTGKIQSFDKGTRALSLMAADGSQFLFTLVNTTFAKVVQNADEPWIDATGQMDELLSINGLFISVFALAYPQGESFRMEAKEITFFCDPATPDSYRFEQPSWWSDQVYAFGKFQLQAQFGDGDTFDFSNYRTKVSKVGSRYPKDSLQEIDTLSRYLYGIATTFLLTGDQRFLKAAREGVIYQRKHMRAQTADGRYVYWYHAVMEDHADHKILPSRFGDDYGAIPLYEQIYALAGLTQYYRITNDAEVLEDIEKTVAFMNRYFRDDGQHKGYFSHIDPVTFSPREDTLGQNRAKKNWNSVGDHAPAYLENLYLGTGKEEYGDMLRYVADLILAHFPDYDHSPFVQEKFHEDWSHDYHWGWQQNRGVVGHNLKIAWCMTRFYHHFNNKDFLALADKIGQIIPEVGADRVRGGWYDVMERSKPDGQERYSFAFHDRKAWWQQEQALLAYQVLYGTTKKPDHLYWARDTAAFWNLAFLDHDDGETYFNVQANGLPYLVGTENMKSSHSKAAYHSFELCYFAYLYTNLLNTGASATLYFAPNNHIPVTIRPRPYEDEKEFRIQPISFPPGSVKIQSVTINGQPHTAFKPEEMIVLLPNRDDDYVMQVTLTPA